MNAKDKECIRTNFIPLGDAIEPQVEDLLDTLYQRGLISRRMKLDIKESNLPDYKKARKLLDLMFSRGGTAFQVLYEAVIELQIFYAADLLKPENAPHSKPESGPHSKPKEAEPDEYDSPEESLPDNWPLDDRYADPQNLRLVEPKHKKMRELFNSSKTPKGQEFTYLMSSKIRGRVLVINNKDFTSKRLPDRDGTIQDRLAIEPLFQNLGFDVCVLSNQKSEDMWKTLVKESENERHVEANCFVLFLLSHGHNGVVFGTDGEMENDKPVNCIEIKKVVDLFCKEKNLQGKPKLFFIQACQGEKKDLGQPVGSGDGIRTGSSDKHVGSGDGNSPGSPDKHDGPSKEDFALGKTGDTADNTYNPQDQTLVKTTVGDSGPKTQPDLADVPAILEETLPTTQSDSSGDKRPSGADVLVAMATLPGHLSWRNTAKGTWFVQAIAFVFAKWAYRHDLGKLMTRVTNLVGRAETEEGYKQQGRSKFTMRKDFYFFPGLPEGE